MNNISKMKKATSFEVVNTNSQWWPMSQFERSFGWYPARILIGSDWWKFLGFEIQIAVSVSVWFLVFEGIFTHLDRLIYGWTTKLQSTPSLFTFCGFPNHLMSVALSRLNLCLGIIYREAVGFALYWKNNL